jgi:hypothetical protein
LEEAPRAHAARPASLLTHSDVLVLLLAAVAVCTACLLDIAAGAHAWDSRGLLLVQSTFCVFACPALALAVRVPPSPFFGEYLHAPRAGLLVRCLFAAVAAETLLVFWFYV